MAIDSKFQIAEFRDSLTPTGFGFDVIAYLSENKILVESKGVLKMSYENFEEFLEDLIHENPLWHTY